MGRNSGVLVCLCAILWTLSVTTFCRAQAAPQNRITQAVDASQMTAVQGGVHPLARPEFDRGPVGGAMKMNVMLAFRPSASQQAALDQLLAEQQDINSPNYHKWLTPEEFGARFGLSQSDLSKVASWLKSQGLTVGRVSRSRNTLSFSGTAAQVEAALHTEIHEYMVNGELHFANATAPEVPAAVAGVVQGFLHLDNFQPKPRGQVRVVPGSQANPHFTSAQTGNHFLSPDDFATIYDMQPLYSAGFDGTGESIAVIGQTVISTSDITAFRAAAGLSALTASNFQQILVPGTAPSTSCTGDLGEADLDVEWSGGVAKGATVLFVYAGVGTGKTCSTRSFNVFDALQYAIQNMSPRAQVISISYGNCEANIGTSFATTLRSWTQQANAQGQTITAASGDAGAADCDTGTSATQGYAVDLPGAVPEVTSVGGTEFTGDASSLTTTPYWTGANGSNDTISSAIMYIPETSWNDTATDLGNGATSFSASGGGASTFFTKPSWQTGTGVPAANHRYMPDVALSASADHDGYLVCSQGSCVSGFRLANGNLTVFGGTSAGSQVMAGILAVLNQATKSSGLGNANMELYTLASSTPLAFHDTTSGNNIVPCTSGSTDCPATAPFQIGFSAGTGYDEVTGLGSLDVYQLAQAWPGFSLAKAASSTALTASASSIPVGTIVTFTATVTAASGNGPQPGGSVEFAVDGVNTGSGAVGSGGAASFTTGSLTVGTHSVTATYSGDVNYLTSTSTAFSETVTNTFTVSASPTSLTASPGGTPTSTITVASPTTNAFNGSVTLTCAVSPATQISCSVSPSPVTLTATTTSTTSTLTVTTIASSAIGTTSADARAHDRLGWLAGSGSALFAGVLLAGMPSRRKRWLALLVLAVLVSVAMGVGCGGGSSSSSSTTGTPAGSYTVTVTGTSGTVTQQAVVGVTVQ